MRIMRLTVLQKELCVWIVFFAVVAAIGIFYIEHTPNDHPGIIRLHVIANSDSPGGSGTEAGGAGTRSSK